MKLKGKLPAMTPVRLAVVAVTVYVLSLIGFIVAMSDSPLHRVYREIVMILALGLFPAAVVATIVAYCRGWTGQAPEEQRQLALRTVRNDR